MNNDMAKVINQAVAIPLEMDDNVHRGMYGRLMERRTDVTGAADALGPHLNIPK